MKCSPCKPISLWRGRALAALVVAATLAGCDTPVVDLSNPPLPVANEAPGAGREARPGNMVTINYSVRLPNGAEVLSAENYRFQLGRGAVIACVDRAVEGMRAGGRRTVDCPPHLHWGRQGYADVIPPNTHLTIEIALIQVR